MNKCPLCQSDQTQFFLHLKNAPLLLNILFATEEEAKTTERVNIDFRYCPSCHFVFNPEFCEAKVHYSKNYNNNQLASQYYQKYIDKLTDQLIKDCHLNSNSRIIEIGCGNGYFLSQLRRKLKAKQIVGYDPAYNNQYDMSDVIHKTYYHKSENESFDLIILRHALESLLDYSHVFSMMVSAMHNHSQLYLETLNLDYMLTHQDISLLSHEYARYYSTQALGKLLAPFNLQVQQICLLFNEQYLGLLAQKRQDIKGFFDVSEDLHTIVAKYKKVLIWGISGRAISMLTHTFWNKDQIQFGVDIDKEKQGQYIPVTGQRIISPQEAIEFHPELVIVANANYLEEIRQYFECKTDFLTLDGQFYRRDEI